MANNSIHIHKGSNNQNYGCITLSKCDSNAITASINLNECSNICSYISNNKNDFINKVSSLEEDIALLKEELNKYKKINANLSTTLYTLIGQIQKEKFISNGKN